MSANAAIARLADTLRSIALWIEVAVYDPSFGDAVNMFSS